MFPHVRVINGDPRHSDHWTLVIDTGEEEVIRTGGHGAYRFEEHGLRRRIVRWW
jgi:hypothetical protein